LFSARRSGYTALYLTKVKISTPSSEDAVEMGIREWPQQSKTGSWQEESEEGELLVRYVLDGSGTLDIEEDGGNIRSYTVAPGSLVQVKGKAVLSWATSSRAMIILTPSFEEGKLFLGAALASLILCISLLSLT
jgi:hypothetical protein